MNTYIGSHFYKLRRVRHCKGCYYMRAWKKWRTSWDQKWVLVACNIGSKACTVSTWGHCQCPTLQGRTQVVSQWLTPSSTHHSLHGWGIPLGNLLLVLMMMLPTPSHSASEAGSCRAWSRVGHALVWLSSFLSQHGEAWRGSHEGERLFGDARGFLWMLRMLDQQREKL